jgi:hypothetical protein
MVIQSSGRADDEVRLLGESDRLGHHVHSLSSHAEEMSFGVKRREQIWQDWTTYSDDDGRTDADGRTESFDLL